MVLGAWQRLCIFPAGSVELRAFGSISIQRVDMPHVKVKENEPFEVAMRRFKRSCEKAGILAEVRRREFYEKPTAERKRKAAAAVKRHLKKLARENRRWERQY